jgi:hypothetical protein
LKEAERLGESVNPPFSDLHGMLQEVRKRPSMWVPDKSLADLETMVDGYSNALLAHGIEEIGSRFNVRFRDYLWTRFQWSMSIGWARAILARSRDADEAFDRFFVLLDEFHAAVPHPHDSGGRADDGL